MRVVLVVAALLGGAPSVEQQARALAAKYRRPAATKVTQPKLVQLGKQLFFDPRLSGAATMSCASCHNPSLSWADGLAKGVGLRGVTLARRTPTILDVGFGQTFMWDGRAESLEEQALLPITAPDEMNLSEAELVARLSNIGEYRRTFAAVFPDAGVSAANVATALAAFERTVVSGQAPFDRWVAGDAKALPESAKRGLVLFDGKAACAKCHSGWRFTDESFHDLGVPDADLGRGGLKAFSSFRVLQHAFKTPSLRDTARRGPWLHDGSAATLEEVVELYDVGGRVKRESLSSDIKPLGLSAQEKADLVEFMRTLSAPMEFSAPVLPRD